ncbi:hypothetical protein ACHAWX_001982 [Stephanocyclus meneghinianus]
MSDRPLGPLGIDPLTFSASLFGLLFLFVLYLLLPRGVRVQYFGAYPKRYAWSARTRGGRMRKKGGGESLFGGSSIGSARVAARPPSNPRAIAPGDSIADANNSSRHLDFNTPTTNQEDIVVSAAMQQLRDPGVLIVAHGSRGKPKTVRLVLTENAITWRTEMRKKSVAGGNKELKLGKLHQVPLSHIMYVDIGKQTTALRRVENAAVSEALCFSLLTKEGSLDLEANSPRERDALVQCFSLVLDEVHAQNWRDIYRGPSSDMPSSFDEGDGGM